MLEVIFLGIFWQAVCFGQQYDETFDKPILRMAPEENPYAEPVEEAEPATEEPRPALPQEPEWVSLLRNNIKKAVHYRGFDNARASIKNMIQQADEEINGEENRKQREIARMRSFVDTGIIGQAYVRADRLGQRWESDLKKYIKGLIGQYGKTHLDEYVRPIVDAIEGTNGVLIKDIDIDPYGEVSIKWRYKDNQGAQLRSDPYRNIGMQNMAPMRYK